MTKTKQPHQNISELLDAADRVCRDAFERGDQLAPFNFAAFYLKNGGSPEDIPFWVADHLCRIAGNWKLNFHADGTPGQSLEKAAGLTGNKQWKTRKYDIHAGIFMCLFEHYKKRARAAIESKGTGFSDHLGRDGRRYPIPENEYTDGGKRCAIFNTRDEPTFEFQVMLARQCGIGGANDGAIYKNVKRILGKAGETQKSR